MRKNNKGFMLVEVIVTSTVIMTAMIGLYTGVNRLYKNYKVRNSYYNIDAMYATNEMIDYFLDNNINEFLANTFQNKQYRKFIYPTNAGCECDFSEDDSSNVDLLNSYCNRIKSFYEVENMLIVEYDKKVLKDDEKKDGVYYDSTLNLNETFKDYINYLTEYYSYNKEEDGYSYIFLTEIYDGKDYYYANIRL